MQNTIYLNKNIFYIVKMVWISCSSQIVFIKKKIISLIIYYPNKKMSLYNNMSFKM